MSLNWNIEKVKNWKELSEGDAWQITQVLISVTMAVGIDEITEKNYKEFYARTNLLERLHGTWMIKDSQPLYFTLEDIERRIGLSTNVSPISRTQFNKRQLDRFYKERLEG